jgi:catalase
VRYRPDAWVHAVSRTSRQDKPADDQTLALTERLLRIDRDAIPERIVAAINANEDRYAKV